MKTAFMVLVWVANVAVVLWLLTRTTEEDQP